MYIRYKVIADKSKKIIILSKNINKLRVIISTYLSAYLTVLS